MLSGQMGAAGLSPSLDDILNRMGQVLQSAGQELNTEQPGDYPSAKISDVFPWYSNNRGVFEQNMKSIGITTIPTTTPTTTPTPTPTPTPV